jgi:pilus assembly protein CpaB
MKRNMIPLLGIAFVVAIISTGVFYGLFAGKLQSSSGELAGHSIVVATRDLDRGTVLQISDLRLSEVKGAFSGGFSKPEDAAGATLLRSVKANEPLLEERVASLSPKAGKSGGIVPAGMRAISMRVSESDGLLSLIQPGARVDVQAISERNGVVELRYILQNVEVLSVSAQPQPTGNRGPVSIVTVLTHAQDSDAVALADSGGRIRLALRNPLDKETTARRSMAQALFKAGQASSVASQSETPAAFDHPIQIRVEALGVSDAALAELGSQLTDPNTDDSLRVATFRSNQETAELVRNLEQKHELEVVSRERLTAGVGRPISFRAGVAPYQLRVQFSPESVAGGSVNLRVKPEISVASGGGVATRKYDAGLPDESSFLVKGFLKNPADQKTLERLFPGHSWEHRQLVIFVTTRSLKSSTVAVAKTNRGR